MSILISLYCCMYHTAVVVVVIVVYFLTGLAKPSWQLESSATIQLTSSQNGPTQPHVRQSQALIHTSPKILVGAARNRTLPQLQLETTLARTADATLSTPTQFHVPIFADSFPSPLTGYNQQPWRQNFRFSTRRLSRSSRTSTLTPRSRPRRLGQARADGDGTRTLVWASGRPRPPLRVTTLVRLGVMGTW